MERRRVLATSAGRPPSPVGAMRRPMAGRLGPVVRLLSCLVGTGLLVGATPAQASVAVAVGGCPEATETSLRKALRVELLGLVDSVQTWIADAEVSLTLSCTRAGVILHVATNREHCTHNTPFPATMSGSPGLPRLAALTAIEQLRECAVDGPSGESASLGLSHAPIPRRVRARHTPSVVASPLAELESPRPWRVAIAGGLLGGGDPIWSQIGVSARAGRRLFRGLRMDADVSAQWGDIEVPGGRVDSIAITGGLSLGWVTRTDWGWWGPRLGYRVALARWRGTPNAEARLMPAQLQIPWSGPMAGADIAVRLGPFAVPIGVEVGWVAADVEGNVGGATVLTWRGPWILTTVGVAFDLPN